MVVPLQFQEKRVRKRKTKRTEDIKERKRKGKKRERQETRRAQGKEFAFSLLTAREKREEKRPRLMFSAYIIATVRTKNARFAI